MHNKSKAIIKVCEEAIIRAMVNSGLMAVKALK
jgi:hypothetical protein